MCCVLSGPGELILVEAETLCERDADCAGLKCGTNIPKCISNTCVCVLPPTTDSGYSVHQGN